MRKLILVVILCIFVVMQRPAHAQQFDAAIGFSALTAPQGTTDSTGTFFPSIRGGLYPSFNADALIKHNIGIEGEFVWRARQNLYGGFAPYRPLFFDFNGIWSPSIGKKLSPEFIAGIGAEDLRFYGQINCSQFTGSCTNYVSSKHFMEDVGVGLRYYVWRSVFVRPEARLYFVNNNVEFSSGRMARFGVSIGYSFRSGF